MKKMILAVVSLLILCFGTVEAADLVVYAALDQETPRQIIKAFKEATGLEAELALQIEAGGNRGRTDQTEAKSPRADCFLSAGNSSIHAGLRQKDFLQPYRSSMIKDAGIDPKFMDSQGTWTGCILGHVLHYNTKRSMTRSLPRA